MVNNKKIALISFIILIIFNINVKADDDEEEDINEMQMQELVVESVAEPTDEPKINARAAIIYDRLTKQVLWGKNENDKRAMASTTKIMTAIVVIENYNLSGDKISVKDLLYGLMLRSRK